MSDHTHLPRARRQLIADRLRRGDPAVAAMLATEFGISEDAIRRDLRGLAAEGLCRRVYGGALPLSPASAAIGKRSRDAVDRKRALAAAAVSLVQPRQTLFLDSGSTNALLAAVLPDDRDLTVVTNSVPAAAALVDRPGLALVIVGGAVSPHAGACVGAGALLALQRLRIDLAFLGACAVSLAQGLAGFDLADVEFKQTLLSVSTAAAALVTNEKLETSAPYLIASLAELHHVVVEADAPAPLVAALSAAGPAVLAAGGLPSAR